VPDDPNTPDWTAGGTPPERIPLGAITLRRWRAADADALDPVIAGSVAHLRGFMPWAASHDRANTEGYLGRCEEQWAERTAFNYAITDATDGSVVGSSGLMGRVGPGALEVGYWVAADRTRRGHATLTTAALTGAAFDLPDVDRVEIHHDVANATSGRIPARLGFTLLREVDAEVDSEAASGRHAIWAMAREEWRTAPGRTLLPGATQGG
jgi:RimJ/RimL family protein N-acetyltransferase